MELTLCELSVKNEWKPDKWGWAFRHNIKWFILLDIKYRFNVLPDNPNFIACNYIQTNLRSYVLI
jgi:hypothetical protein